MKLKEIKNWIDSLPEEFLDFDTVVSTYFEIDEDNSMRYDTPILALDIDGETKEILFEIQAQQEVTFDSEIEQQDLDKSQDLDINPDELFKK